MPSASSTHAPRVTRAAAASPASGDRLGWLVLTGSVAAMLAFVGLDLFVGLPAGGAGSTISAYVYTDGAWIFRLAILALAGAATALLIALTRRRVVRWWSAPAVLLALTVIGLLAVAGFPKTDWSVGDSLPGQLHRLGSLIAFLAPPFATMALTRRRGAGRRPPLAARGAFWTALAVLGVLAGVVAVVVIAVNAGGAWWGAFPLGLIERTVVGLELVSMALLGVWLTQAPESR